MANEVDPIIIDVGFKEDSSIQDVITHLSTVKEKMEDIGDGSKGSTAFLDQLGLTDMGRQEIVTTLGTMITGLSGVGETLTSIPAHLAQSFSVLKSEITGIETLLNSVNGKQKSLVNDSNKGMQSIQHMMMSVAGMSAQSQNVTEFAKAFRGATEASIGWSAQDLARYAPQVVSMVLEPAVRRIQAENKHGIGFNGIVSSIMRDNNNVAYLQNLAKLSGHENGMSKEQVQANYEMMLRGWTPYAMSTGAASKLLDWKARGVYETKQQALRVEDRFTKDANDYQKLIFSGYGKNDYVERQAADYIKSQGGSPIRSYTKHRQSGLQELHRFLQQGNNMDELFPLLQEAGIATVNSKGQYQIFNNIREQQLQYLRARALQEYSNALRSDAPYEGNPTDVLSAGRMTGRQGRRPTLYLGLNNALPEDVIPSLAGFDKKTMSGYGGKINTGVSIGKTPTLARYYIPQTSIDFGTGKAVIRNNFWQKDLAKGIEQRPDDEQVAITDSLIARMFGMQGDRTLGFGHDEKTGAIKRTTKVVGADGKTRDVELTPNLFTADFSKFITYDEEKGKYVVDKTHPDYKRAERILSGQELVDYGVNPQTGKAEKYRFLYSKDDGRAIFGKESIAQEIEARYAAAHLPSPFKYGNDRENGILFDDNAKTIKQINAMAKMASSGTAIEDLMSPEQANKLKNATGIYANFEMMYDILDDMEKESGGKYTGKWSKIMGRRMDGLAFGDPTIFSKDFQGRFGAGTDKFAMGAYDWRPMLLAGWEAGRKLNSRLYGYDETYDPNYNGPNKAQYEKEHRAIWAPTGGASKEDYAKIRQYISGKGENGQDLTEDELADLRRQYFTNTVAKEAGYIIDRSASKSGSGYRTMSLENFWNGKEGFFTKADYEQALADNRIKNGEVQLLPWQQEKFRREYAALAMPGKSGFIEMKNEGDMFSDKDFIPESVLRGVNAPQEVFEKSERLYKQRLDELNTTAGRIKQFQGDANALEAITQDPSWVWNDHTAITHIEQTRRALEARRARHEVLTEGNREGNIAVGTVGQLAEIFQAMTGMSDKDYGEFQTLLPSVMEGKNAVFSKGVSASVIDMLTRFPFASGQYLMDVNNYAQMYEGEGENRVNIIDDYMNSMEQLEKTQNQLKKLRRRNDKNPAAQRTKKIAELETTEAELQTKVAGYQDRIKSGTSDADMALKMADALRKSGRDPRSITSMMMTAGQIYSMNTGDFDGDTVNAFIGMSEAFKENARSELNKVAPEIRRQREMKLREVPLESPEESPFLSKGEGVMESWARASTATQKMAVASAALRKAQSGDPNDPTRVIALAEAMQAYDLATSDVKTKGAEFNLGSYAEKYLYSQGAHYERFIKQLQDNSDDGTSTDRGGLFRFSAASTLDPEGVFAMSARHSNASFVTTRDEKAREEFIKSLTDAGLSKDNDEYKQRLANWDVNNRQIKQGIFDLDSYEKMENWYRSNFGAERTEEAKAARFYLDKMEDNLIWGKLWNQEDIDKGNKLIQNWGSSLDARTQAGQNVAEERARFEDFRKRMGEMVDEKGIAGTEDNVRKLAERYEKMALEEVDETKSKGYSLYAENLRRMLPESETAEERTAREAFIQTKKHSDYVWSKEVNSLIEASKDQENLDDIVQNTRIGNIVALAKGEVKDRSIYNWSNVKHFVGSELKDGKLYLDGLEKVDLNTGSSSPIAAHTVDYYKNADSLNRHMRDMILEASGEKDRTEAYRNPMTHIGQLMHSTFELGKMPTEVAQYANKGGAEALEAFSLQWMREALLGMTGRDTTGHDMAALRSLGLGFIQDEKGDLKAINVGGKNRFSTNELNDYSNIVNNLLGTSDGHGGRSKGFMQRQFEELRAREADTGEQVLSIEDKLYRDGQKISDDFGGIIYRRVVTDKEGNIVHSESSLDRDFTQSAYQTKEGENEHIYETHAKPDYVTIDKNGKLHVYDWKSSEQGAFESIPQSMFYANMFTELGKKFHETGDQRYEQFKEWYDPKTGQSTVKTITGVNPQGGGENYNFDATTTAGREKIAEIARKVDRGMLTEEALGLAGFQDAWPYLTRIADRREEIGETVKSARQMIDNNEFSASNAEMDFFLSTYGQNKERLSQLRADVFKEHNKDTMNEYIPQDRFTKRERELKEMFSQQELAAVIANAGDSEMINSEIQKIQDTRAELLALNEADAMKAVSGDISNAKTSIRQMLTGVRPTNESNVVFGAVNALRRASETKEYLKADKQYVDDKGNFKVNDANETIRNVAQARSDAYEQAIKDEQEANVFLTENLVEYTSKYEKKSNAKIDALTRTKPLDPVESFQKFVQERQEELQKQIDQYNENVKKYDEEIKNAQNPETKASLQRLRDIDQANADRLQEFADKGGVTEQAIAEQRRRLGMETETPEQQSERWLNERLAVVKADRAKKFSTLMDLETSDQSTLAERQKAEKDYQRTIDEENMLKAQADSMTERRNRQRTQQLEDATNALQGKQLTSAEQAERKVDALRDQIAERRDRLGLNDPLRAQYDAILNDKAAWQAAQKRTKEEITASKDLQLRQSDFRVDQLLRQGEQLDRNKFGQRTDFIGRALNRRDQLISSRQNYKNQIDTQLAAEQKKFSGMKEGDKGYAQTASHIKDLKAASQEAGQAITELSGPLGTAGAVAAQFGTTIGHLAHRLGRRLFMKATQEAKRFVQEFDKSMTTIQMITLKSDSQMSTLGDGLIAKAKELKISISEITQSAETLYRQGLSDEEVNERLDVISKFSKVSGTKVDAATKLITIAMNTGLVTDPQMAADIVTALGDNAATNASEIEKGIEKAGAAAAADGTTFGQLAAMLTAITSTTQIGGNVAGRTLNTIFGRMNKIGTNELIYDENGHAVSGSAVAKLLEEEGIKQYDTFGNKRSSYDVLYELSKKWEGLSDAKQQRLATAIAGTRQYSNFSAIMQGMSEGKVDEYMSLVAGSEGIVDEKYDIYTKSLQASLTDLKNTFDELVQDLVDKGYVKDFIGGITTMISGVDKLVTSIGGLQASLPIILALVGAMSGAKIGGGWGALIGAVAGLGTYGLLNSLGSSGEMNAEQILTRDDEAWSSINATRKTAIEQAETLLDKGSNRTDSEERQFRSIITNLGRFAGLTVEFTDTSVAVKKASDGAIVLSESLVSGAKSVDLFRRVIDEAEQRMSDEEARHSVAQTPTIVSAIASSFNTKADERNAVQPQLSSFVGLYNSLPFENGGQAFLESEDPVEFLRTKRQTDSKIDGIGLTQAAGRLYLNANGQEVSGTWNTGYRRQLAEALAQYTLYGGEDIPEKYRGYTADQWESELNRLTEEGNGGRDSLSYNPPTSENNSDFVTVLKNAGPALSSSTAVSDSEYDTREYLRSSVKEKLKGHVPDDLLDPFTESIVNRYMSTVYPGGKTYGQTVGHINESVLSGIVSEGMGYSLDTDMNSVGQEVLRTNIESFIGETDTETSAAPTVISVGKNGYYYDKVHNEYITAEEAERRLSIGATYRNRGYESSAAANAARTSNINAAVQAEMDTGRHEKLVWYKGLPYGEESQDKLSAEVQRDAVIHGRDVVQEELAYLDEEGALEFADYVTGKARSSSVYRYTNANGQTTFAATEDDEALERARKNDYETMRTLAFNNSGLATAEYWAKPQEERVQIFEDWWRSQGGQTYEEFAGENEILETDRDYEARNDLEAASLQRARDEAELSVYSQYKPTTAYRYGENLYSTMQDAIDDNMETLIADTLEYYGASDISELPTTEGTRWKYKDQWYNSYEEAEAAIRNQVEELFNAGSEAVTVNDQHVTSDDLIPYENMFINSLGSYSTGFKTKNEAALNSDTITRLLMSGQFGTGKTGVLNLMRYANSNSEAGAAWSSVIQNNQELQRVMQQVHYNEETGEIEAPDDIMEQILRATQGGSLTYGKAALTTQQKGSLAQEAYSGLTSGMFASQEEMLTAQEQAWIDYQNEPRYQAYLQAIANIDAQEGMPQSYKETVKASIRSAYGYPVTTKEAFIASRPDLTVGYVSPEQMTYLKEVVGDQMYARILEANSGGKKLTDEEQTYVSNILQNRSYGLTSLTAGQQLQGIRDVRQAIAQGKYGVEGGYSTQIADQYMSQWSGWGEYSALIQKRNALAAEGKTLDVKDLARLQVLESSLENFQENTEFKFEIEGIQELENAGKIASGVSNELESLRKGGKVALEVTLKYRTEGFEAGQQVAKLENGTTQQQDEAAMAILGMSSDQYYANREANYKAAISVSRSNRQFQADTWTTRYNGAQTAQQKLDILEAARLEGYDLGETNIRYGENGRESDLAFVWKGTPGLVNGDYFAGKQRTYTEAELAAARRQLFTGNLTKDSDNELYQAAAGSLGTYGSEYFRQLTAFKNGTGKKPSEELRRLAEAEATLSQETADQADAVERARLGSTTAGGAFTYARVQREQNNRAAMAADQIFGSLDPTKIKSFTDLTNSVNGSQAANWKELINSSGDLARKLEDMGVKVGENGELDFSGVESAGYDLKDVLLILRDAASEASDSLQGFKEVLSTGEEAERAREYFGGTFTKEGREAFSSYIGNENIAQLVTNNELAYQSRLDEYNEYMALDRFGRKEWRMEHGYKPTNPGEYDPFAGLEGENLAYATRYYQNAGIGVQGLTEIEQVQGFEMLLEAARNGNLAQVRAADRTGYYNEYASAVTGGSEYLSMVEELQAAGIDYKQFAGVEKGTDAYDRLVKAFGGVDEKASRFLQIQKDVSSELAGAYARSAKKAGEYTDQYAESVGKLAKGGVTARKEMARLTDEMLDYQDAVTAANKSRGKTGKQIVKDKTAVQAFQKYLGFDEADIKTWSSDQASRMSDLLLDAVEEEFSEANFSPMIQGAFNDINNALSNGQITLDRVLDIVVNPETGEIDYSAFVALLQEIDSNYSDIAEQYAGRLLEWFISITTTGNSVAVDRSVGKLKGGGKGGYNKKVNNGSGSGKTKTDALIEGQSHYIKRREHDVNMAQERETRYEKTNNYQGYLNALNDEISAQERLKSQYEANITALEEQLSTLKEGTEEWYKCQEAIDSAEEAMAKIDNEIDNINSKRISITETKQANQDKPISHASTMLQLKAQNYLEQGQFEKYEAVTKAQIANYNNDIQLNNVQIEEWEELLATYEEGTQDWLTVRDKIWALKEENAELENNMLKETHELEQARIAQIATDLQNAMAPLEHEQNMLGTWSGIYQKGHQYGAYRGALESQNAYNQGQAALYQNALNELQAQINTLEVGSEAWLNARSAIFEYQEALAQVTASIQENDAAIEESYVSEVTEHYQDATKTTEHELKMAQIAAQRYKNEGDYLNYENMLNVERDLTGNQLAAEKNSLTEMEALFTSGKLKEGSDQWKALREQIMSLRETVSQTESDYESLTRQIRETKFENAVEQFNTKDNELQHEIRIIQYQETKYQNNGELTNYGRALEWDNEAQQRRAALIREQIDLLKEQRDAAKDDPQLYNKIDAEIMKMEEQLESTNNTIEKNNTLIEKNQENIRKIQQSLENTIDKEIKNREKLRREMLAGEISTQNSILDVIKKRYQDEFNLVKKDIENKKKALNEEKNLINERLNARKAAVSAEEKYEKLAELQGQLALIASDPTRTKDAKELRKQIADLQKEISWDIAEDETKMAIDAIDDQIKAYDELIQTQQEDLADMLENANNFANEINQIMSGSYEDYLNWMKENSKTYKNATDETRAQMEDSWHDTWLKMKGETETYWQDVAALMQNKDSFLEFMKQSQEYINASESGRLSLEYQWGELYDQYQSSLIDNAEFNDNHDVLEKISEMKDWTYKVEPVVDSTWDYGQYSTGIEYWYQRKKDNTKGVAQDAIDEAYDEYSSVIGSEASLYESQKKKEEESSVPEITIEITNNNGSTTTNTDGKKNDTPATTSDTTSEKHGYSFVFNGTRYEGTASSKDYAKKDALNFISSLKSAQKAAGKSDAEAERWASLAKDTLYTYETGGLVDFTGPAWVDGTKTRPEAFLSAVDTENIRAMLDAFDYIRVNAPMLPSTEMYDRNTTNVGDINIIINQAELKSDADVDALARKVGKSFTKQLSKQGFNLAGYSF